MMDGFIGTVVSIVGGDMVNANNRRDFKAEEYDLYDVRKARPFWNQVCEANNWQVIKDEEDFAEDFVCKILDNLYVMELQVVGYWHNFDKDYISNLWISASKVDNLKKKAQEKNTRSGLIFLNCVPNRFIGIDVEEIKESYKVNKASGEKSYKIPLQKIYYLYKELLDRNFCDCLENHIEIMEQGNGRIPMAQRNVNLRGKNGICC